MSEVKLILGDCLVEMAKLEADSIDGMFFDPPYGLEFMGKEWDKFNSGRSRQKNENTAICRGSEAYKAGTPFQKWTQSWATEALRVLKPGGYLLAFGGTRTYHRLTCGIEDAGFVIKDTLCWLYSSGFPKSMNISKAFDKKKGINKGSEFAKYIKTKRQELGLSMKKVDEYVTGGTTNYNWFEGRSDGQRLPCKKEYQKIKKILELDDRFDKYIGEAEREIVGKGRAGLTKGTIANFTGEIEFNITLPATDLAKTWDGYGTALKPAHEPIVLAQKPLDGTYCQNLEKHEVGALNIDAGRINIDKADDIHAKNPHTVGGILDGQVYGKGKPTEYAVPAGRFPANLILDGEAAGLLDKQGGISKSTGGTGEASKQFTKEDEIFKFGHSAFGGYGDKGYISRFFYVAKASQAERGKGNNHPTVKPIALMMYLAKLILPHHKPVVWLDPFLGSGTSALAAAKLNDEEHYQISFIGIDQEEKYIEIAKQRLAEYNKSVQLRIPGCPSQHS